MANPAEFRGTCEQSLGRVLRLAHGLCVLAAAAAIMTASTAAAAPMEVALVEGSSSNSSGVSFMDYVHAGQVIRLAPGDTLVLTYMNSCMRETITGGIVTVGTDGSDVRSGRVVRTKGECGMGRMVLTSAQTQIGGRSFRGPATEKSKVTE